MTDAQARERCWRIGQAGNGTVYRLILAGTIEEKIYQRQIYKQFLSHKVMVDPRDQRTFRGWTLPVLFEPPPPPAHFDPEAVRDVSTPSSASSGSPPPTAARARLR